MKDLASIRTEVRHEHHWFTEEAARVFLDKGTCQVAKRKRLLSLFVKDLSSGVCGEVLENKVKRDQSKSGRGNDFGTIAMEYKALGWISLIVLNMAMLFYVYLFAMNQSSSRQSAWFQSFVIWFLFDLFLASTGVVLVTHLFIPLYVLSDIRKVKRKVLNDILTYQQAKRASSSLTTAASASASASSASASASSSAAASASGHTSLATIKRPQQTDFNAAKYLFTSWRVASLVPDLPESDAILQFRTLWPKRSYKREKKKIKSTYDRKFSFLTGALSRVFIFFLSSLIQFPLPLQDVFIQIASNTGLGYLLFLFLDLYEISPLLPLAPVGVLLLLIHFLMSSTSRKHSLDLKQQKESGVREDPETTPTKPTTIPPASAITPLVPPPSPPPPPLSPAHARTSSTNDELKDDSGSDSDSGRIGMWDLDDLESHDESLVSDDEDSDDEDSDDEDEDNSSNGSSDDSSDFPIIIRQTTMVYDLEEN
jgi:hypothetical protein